MKSRVVLTTQPKVTLSAASAYKSIVFGGEATYDTAKSTLSGYGVAVGLHAADSQIAVHLQVCVRSVACCGWCFSFLGGGARAC